MNLEAIDAGKWYHYHGKLANYYNRIDEPVWCAHHRKKQESYKENIVANGWEEVLTDQSIIDHIANPSGRGSRFD